LSTGTPTLMSGRFTTRPVTHEHRHVAPHVKHAA